jgi:murein L,D-transpeptidase YcbB/YkuD
MYITQKEEVAIIKLLAIARTYIPDETEWQRLVEMGQIVKFGDISKQVSDMIERIEKKRIQNKLNKRKNK